MAKYRDVALKILSGEIEDFDAKLLSEIVIETNDLFHNGSESYLTDAEYDAIELLFKKYTDVIPVGSPVRTGKVDLPTIMGSLDQVYENDTLKFVQDNKFDDQYFIIGDKQDGVSGSSTYINGKLRVSYSRGDGEQGADVTRHISKIKNAIKNINHKGILEVRYEVIIPIKEFEEYKQKLIDANHPRPPKNPRNYTAGQMNAETSEDWFYNNAKVIVTSLLSDDYKMDKSEEYEFLSSLGFDVTFYEKHLGKNLTDDFLTAYLNDRREKSLTEIDGIVLDVNDKTIRKNMKWKEGSLNPPYSKKYKIASEDNFADVDVIKVHWNPRKSGYIKPRIEFNPVELRGVTVSFCSGFNAKFIVDNKIGPGAVLRITRAGDVIPDITDVIKTGELIMPDDDYEWNDTNVDIVIKDKSHKGVITSKLASSFGELKIPNLKMASIEKLYDAGYDTMASIIKMTESELQNVVGTSSGSKIYNGIKDKLNPIKISTLAGSSNMLGRGVGVRMMELLSKSINYDAILNPKLTVNEISNINGFGDKTAILIKSNQKDFLKFIKEIEGYYTFVDESKLSVGNKLNGIKVCFTGVRSPELETYIKDNGGEIVGSPKNDANFYLVCKDKTKSSAKMDKARELVGDDNILTLEEAFKLWKE